MTKATTTPIYLNRDTQVCREVFVRFNLVHIGGLHHRVSDEAGAQFLHLTSGAQFVTITYVSETGMVLKSISYNVAHVVEVTSEDSVCMALFGSTKVVAPPKDA